MTYVKRWKNKVMTAPADVKPGDGFALKVVAVVYDDHWTVYQGLSD